MLGENCKNPISSHILRPLIIIGKLTKFHEGSFVDWKTTYLRKNVGTP